MLTQSVYLYGTYKEVIAEKENEWTIYIRGSEILASSSDYAKTFGQVLFKNKF